MASVNDRWTERPDLFDRLLDVHHYGLTDLDRCEMRKEAAEEIRALRDAVVSLRERVEQLEELNRIRVHRDNVRPR